jgi:hypothetical protein
MDLIKRFVQGLSFGKKEVGPRWRTPAVLDRGPLGDARLALNERGHGMAMWENKGTIWSMPVGPRSSPALLRLPVGEGVTPRIALNSEGRGIVLWQSDLSGEMELLGKILGAGDDMAQVIFRTRGCISHLQAATDRRSNVLVVWLHEEQGQFEVLTQSYDARELSWEQLPTVLSIPSVETLKPHIAVNDRACAMVLWEVREKDFEGLVASHYWPSDRIWSDRPVPVVDHATRHHQVVMDELGNALAVWIHAPYGQRATLEASFYDVHCSEWQPPQVLSSAHIMTPPRLVMSARGEALVAWSQGEGHGNSHLYCKAFSKGLWASEAECLESGHGVVRDFAIAVGSEGQAGLLTIQEGPDGYWPSARLRQGHWSAPVSLSPASRVPCSSPRMALCPQGASVLWIQGTGNDKLLTLSESS